VSDCGKPNEQEQVTFFEIIMMST